MIFGTCEQVARCILAVPRRAMKPVMLPLGASRGSSPKGVVCISLAPMGYAHKALHAINLKV